MRVVVSDGPLLTDRYQLSVHPPPPPRHPPTAPLSNRNTPAPKPFRNRSLPFPKTVSNRFQARLEKENADLRSILKQYLDGISVNDDVLNNPVNPLLVVNNRLQVGLVGCSVGWGGWLGLDGETCLVLRVWRCGSSAAALHNTVCRLNRTASRMEASAPTHLTVPPTVPHCR